MDGLRESGDSVGARMYNGSGDAAVAYSADLLRKAEAWKARLDGAAPVPVPSAGGPLRRGDRGERVVRLTRRLARARSTAGTPYLAKPRRELDATVEAALKAFQAEHGLEADGIYGPLSQRKLNRVLRLQQDNPPTGGGTSHTGLRPLVEAVLRHDARSGEAWEALVSHAAKRRRLLPWRRIWTGWTPLPGWGGQGQAAGRRMRAPPSWAFAASLLQQRRSASC